ncbi:MAG: TIGR00730 family Rossman fold protein [Candidatus Paceibacterota bacterium]|jgi:hypothetical protein
MSNNYSNNIPPDSISRDQIYAGDVAKHLDRITHEFADGFDFLKKYPRSVTIFGSSLAKPTDQTYIDAVKLGEKIVKELNYAVVTGGGPGIMEAANKGAYEAGGASLGVNVSLPHERSSNAYVTQSIKCSYFFSRKTILMFAAECFVFFPGGFGTMDELFNVLTLIQTDKIPRVPVVLFDSEYWKPFQSFLSKVTEGKYHAVDDDSLALFEITDSLDRVIEIISKAPVSETWRNIN